MKKRAHTKMGSWQARWLVLQGGVLYYYEKEENVEDGEFAASTDVSAVREVRPLVARGAGGHFEKADHKVLVLNGEQLKCADAEDVARWVAAIKRAKEAAVRGDGRRKPGGGGGGGGGDSDDDEGGGLPPPPKWFKAFAKEGERARSAWALATQKLLGEVFAAVNDAGQPPSFESQKAAWDEWIPGVIKKLLDCATTAMEVLLERCAECRLRKRPDVAKFLVRSFDVTFNHTLGSLTTGHAPSLLKPAQLLQLLDCIEGYLAARGEALGGAQLGEAEGGAGGELREQRAALADIYLSHIKKKLRDIVNLKIGLLNQTPHSVHTVFNSRLSTGTPTDLFNVMTEFMKQAKKGGSKTLCRRLLSAVMAEVSYFSQNVLMNVMDEKKRSEEALDAAGGGGGGGGGGDTDDGSFVDFITAVVNDSGFLLDNIEQLESFFAESLEKDEREVAVYAARGVPAGLAPEEAAELEAAVEDLKALEFDIPRTKDAVLASGVQLVGVWVEMVTDDTDKDDMGRLFGKEWEKGKESAEAQPAVSVMCATAEAYLTEYREKMDPFFFTKLAQMVLAHLVEGYLLRLLVPDMVKAATVETKGGKRVALKLAPGHTAKTKLNLKRVKQLLMDIQAFVGIFGQVRNARP